MSQKRKIVQIAVSSPAQSTLGIVWALHDDGSIACFKDGRWSEIAGPDGPTPDQVRRAVAALKTQYAESQSEAERVGLQEKIAELEQREAVTDFGWFAAPESWG